ncbi:hypothetical protein DFJ77DRAFT_453387 [Powellomyces hirtus]|nr:hypothetical protein DFJ77DRAFT_453387 [Powellomyces hirtus]
MMNEETVVWQPLPKGIHGVVTAPWVPTRLSQRASTSLSISPSTTAAPSTPFPPLESSTTAALVTLELGDTVHLLEECDGWLRGYVYPTLPRDSGPELGVFPASHVFSRALMAKRATAAEKKTGMLGAVGPLPGPAVPPTLEDRLRHLTDSHPQRPGLTRGVTAPVPQSYSLPSGTLPDPDATPGSKDTRPTAIQRPLSYAPGFTVGSRKVVHPIPASVRPNHETSAGLKEALIDEIAAVLRDWGQSIKGYLDAQQYDMFNRVHALFKSLSQGRRTLLSQTLKQEELIRLRKQLIALIEDGNQLQNGDLVIRHTEKGHILSERNTTIINIYRMHLQQAQRRLNANARQQTPNIPAILKSETTFTQPPSPPIDLEDLASRFTHMFFELKTCTGSFCLSGEYVELRFALYNHAENRMLTEDYVVHINGNGIPSADGLKNGKARAIFADLPQRDLSDKIFLTCRLVRVGKMNVSEKESEKADKFGMGSLSSLGSLGSMESSSSSLDLPSLAAGNGNTQTQFRRPLGWSVVRIGEWLKLARGQMEEERDIAMRIYVPTAEASFPNLCDNIINKSGGYELASRAEMLTVTLNVIQGELTALAESNPTLFDHASLTPRNGFSDVLVPGDTRNALYLTLVSGEFSQGRKTNIRNVQVTVQIRLADGEFVEGCLSCGTGEGRSGSYDSLVYYHNAAPRWNEVIRIDIPPDVFKKAHVFFTYRHCSSSDKGGDKDKHERNFAFSFLPLLRGGQTVINDASHTLTLYKYDQKTAVPFVYLNYSAGANILVPAQLSPQTSDSLAAAVDAMSRVPTLRDSFIVRTQLCSTRLTQNVALHNLLHWRYSTSNGRQPVKTVLSDFIMIGELEIIKFLPSILEALFAILDSKEELDSASGPDLDQLVFSALVFTLGIVMDKRFTNHRNSVDRYIHTKFKSTRAWEVLMRGFETLIRHPEDVGKSRELRSAIKVWRYILRFAIRSNGLGSARARRGSADRQDQRKGGANWQDTLEQNDSLNRAEFRASGPPTASFIQSLTSLFAGVNQMMTLTSPDFVIASQTLALQYFATILPDLAQLFPATYMVNVAATFVDSVRSNRAKLNGYKLLFIKELVRGFLFADGQSRGVLVGCVSRWVSEWAKEWIMQQQGTTEDGRAPIPPAKNGTLDGERENVKLCLDVIAEMLDKLQRVAEKREKEKSRLGKGLHEVVEGTSETVPMEEHNATIMCIAELLPKLLEMYRSLMIEIDGAAGTEGRLKCRERAGSWPSPTTNQDHMMPRSPEIAQLGSILLAVAHLLKDDQIQAFLVRYFAEHGARETVGLVSLLCEAFGDMISDEPFSPFWVGMNMIAHRISLKMLRPVSELLRGEFLGARDEEDVMPSNRLSVVFSIAESDHSNGDLRSSARSFQTGGTLHGTHGTGINGGGPSTLSEASGAQALIHRLWDRYFHVLLQLLNSRWLQIERFGPQRSRVAHKLGADVRGEGGEMLRTMWEHLGSTARGKALQAGFIPSLVGPFLQLTASPHPVLRSAAIELLFNTIEPEFEQVGHFGRVELECIERLHRLVTQDNLGDETYRRFIVDALERRFVTRAMLNENDDHHGQELTAQGQAFLNCLDGFLELSLQIRDLPIGEQHDDQREEALVKMLRFLRTTGRRGVYVEYVHRLHEMQLGANNPIEAALALKLHGDLFEWRSDATTEPLSAFGFPEWQTEFDRKEAIYLRCVELLEGGQAWERAVELCREIGTEYEKNAYSYGNLADILHRQADMYASIATTSRSQPEYYRVGFYGHSCPPSLRNKQYVYRGGDWEKLGSFCDRILQKYPGAKLAKSNAYPPPAEITDGEGLWLQVSAVKPVVDARKWNPGKTSGALGAIKWEQSKSSNDGNKATSQSIEETHADLLLIEPDLNVYGGSAAAERGTPLGVAMDHLDERVRAYYETNEVGMFSFARPMRKPLPEDFAVLQAGDPAREFLELWTEKIVLVTQDSFPCLSRRSAVVRVEMFELSPVENAVIAVRGKTRQLMELERRFAPFAMKDGAQLRRSLEVGSRQSGSFLPASSSDSIHPGSPQQNRRTSAEIPSVNPFTMALNGAVDAPVNGGIPMYKRAFLSPEYRAQAERDGTEIVVNLLERAIEEQVEVIHRCLIIHDLIVPQPMRPLHEEIIGFFAKNFAEDISRLGLSSLRPALTLSIPAGRLSDEGGGAAGTALNANLTSPPAASAPSLSGYHSSSATDLASLLTRSITGKTAAARITTSTTSSTSSTPATSPPVGRRRSTVGLRHSGSTASSSRSSTKRDLFTSSSMVALSSTLGAFQNVLPEATISRSTVPDQAASPLDPPTGSAGPPRSTSRGDLNDHSGDLLSNSGTSATGIERADSRGAKKDRFGGLGKLFDKR